MSIATMNRALALVVFASLSSGGLARATDHPISGKKLLLKDNPKLVLISKDTNITAPGSICNAGPPEVPFAKLIIDDGTNRQVFELPCANWKSNPAGTTWTYKNKQAPAGPSAIKVVKLKNGLIKAVGKGLGDLPVPNGAANVDVVLNIGGVSLRYCMSFAGTGEGSKFSVKDAPAGSCAPEECQADTAGLCWFLAGYGQSCAALCADLGLAYDPATASYAGDIGSDSNCLSVLNDLGLAAGTVSAETCLGGAGCVARPGTGTPARCTAPPTTAAGADPGFRACACQ